MSYQIPMLVKIFKIALEEAEEDVASMLDYYSKRFENDQITNYVWLENSALLKKELSCVTRLRNKLEGWDPPEVEDQKESLEKIRDYLKSLIKKESYPEFVGLVVDRISNKIYRYID